MNQEHKTFILEKLIPFIKREQGKGFAMEEWLFKAKPGTPIDMDFIDREVPKCGTIACIGGSIDMLMKLENPNFDTVDLHPEAIGLTNEQANVLFFGWTRHWPEPFRTNLKNATTTEAKADVACDLLKFITENGPEILIHWPANGRETTR